jgi:hypothetical protein
MFYRAGGLLVAGTDPTAGGGTIAGFSNHRQFELMVEGGFTPLEAIKVMTLNGAIYMQRDKLVGSIAAGKQRPRRHRRRSVGARLGHQQRRDGVQARASATIRRSSSRP